MPEATLVKICTHCHQEYPNTTEYFYRRTGTQRSKTDELRPICKPCHQIKQNSYRRDLCDHCKVPLKATQRRTYCSTRCKVLYKLGGVGTVYERLTILDFVQKSGASYVQCLCACGTTRDVPLALLKSGQTKSCGCWHRDQMRQQTLDKHPLWRGGRMVNNRGYVLIKLPDHPNAQKNSGGYVLEHVYVMSEFLGRPLRKGETVHHKNGIKADNHLSNLELWTVHQPYGQRAEDVLAWCKAYIAQYEADVRKLQQVHTTVEPQPSLFT